MHTSFTGTSRKPRQVNLSGRNANPWAPSKQSLPSGAGAQNAVARAEVERQRRAQERDRQNAARKVQRVWRSHASRRIQKQKWRDEFDAVEQERLGRSSPMQWEREVQRHLGPAVAHRSRELLLSQLRLIVAFLNVKDTMDTMRLCLFSDTLLASSDLVLSAAQDEPFPRLAGKLSNLMCHFFGSTADSLDSRSRMSTLLHAQRLLIPYAIGLDYQAHFHALCTIFPKGKQMDAVALLGDTVEDLLLKGQTAAYRFFILQFYSKEPVALFPEFDYLETTTHFGAFSDALIYSLDRLDQDSLTMALANTIFLFRKNPDRLDDNEGQIRLLHLSQMIASLLSRCANTIARRVDVIDQPMQGSTADIDAPPLNSFAKEQILYLPQRECVEHVLTLLRGRASDAATMAKPLANYAVAMLRAFPTRATNIRMWLYRSSPSSASSDQAISTIQYLWKATQLTNVFQRIRLDQKDVLSVLTEAKPPSTQFKHVSPSATEIRAWQEDWRIVLLFLELYTFILKLMDDEEFFALKDVDLINGTLLHQLRQGALPLKDIALLGNFLKNLAFCLYWNAADLAESNEPEDAPRISSLFAQDLISTASLSENSAPRTLAGNDVSQDYLKGLATGLLRMLHERDSRRKFLPNDYWLMTKHFDLQDFIPAVVDEEERRHRAVLDGDDDDDVSGVNDQNDTDEAERFATPSLGSLFNIRPAHMNGTQNSRFAEQLNRQREQARKKRLLQSLNPRLEILRNLPFFIPFETRVQIFRRFVFRDQERRRHGYVEPDDWRMSVAVSQGRDMNGRPRGMDVISRHHANIHRGSVFEDAFDNFHELGEELKEPIQISFIDQFDQPEAGIDGGGVTKEFLMSVTGEALDPHSEMAMFEENEQRYLYPRPVMLEQTKYYLKQGGLKPGSEAYNRIVSKLLQQYEFLGRIIGKCMYEGILIDVSFAGFFLLKWALTGGTTSATSESQYRASLNDLRDFDEPLYQGLLKLKNYPGDIEADLGLNFTVTDTFEYEGKAVNVTAPLVGDGANKPVTNTNKLYYIDAIVRYRLQEQPRLITNHFLKGLGQIISPMWLAMFNQKELQKLVGGDNTELDISDLRRNTQYGGLYVIGDDGVEHPVVQMFWSVLKSLDDADRRRILKFVTSTPRAPLLGFSHLNPKFSIRDSSEDQTRLPSTSTCVNLLKLPRYANATVMREKLLYAANAGAGFDLS